MNIKPIKDETSYEAALQEIDRLFDAQPDTPEADRLEVLVTLVEAYEDKHYDLPPPDPIDALVYYLESRGLAENEFQPYIGTRAHVSEILNRKRPLTLNMIRNLSTGTGIPASILIQPYQTEQEEEEKYLPASKFQQTMVLQPA